MTPDPYLPAARRWWQGQSTRRKGFAIGGAAVVILAGASAAAGGREPAADAPATTIASASTEHVAATSREHVSSTTVAPATTLPATTLPATTAVVEAAPATTLPVTYTVAAVVDGDTVDVVASDGSAGFTVRLIGIDAPESGSCEADAATWTLTSLVQGQQVSLTSGGDGEDTDRYGRSLRYVDLAGVDAGLRLIEDGLAVARYDSRDGYGAHTREATYASADERTPAYACPPPTTRATLPPQPPAPPVAAAAPSGCDPNYTGCVPIDSDVDCAGGSGNGPSYADGPVDVIGNDVYGLDRDGDGVGCE